MASVHDDIDIYGDLPNFNLEETIQKLENENKALSTQVSELTLKVEQLEAINKQLTKVNKNLSANISILFKTAKLELDRKINTIQELSKERDDILFRRFKFVRPKDRPHSEGTNTDAPSSNCKYGYALRGKDWTSRNSNGKGYQENEHTALKSKENTSNLKEQDRREEETSALQPRIPRSSHRAEPPDLEWREASSSVKEKETSTAQSRTKRSLSLRENSRHETEAPAGKLMEGSSNSKGKNLQGEEASAAKLRSARSFSLREKGRRETETSTVELKEVSSNPREKNRGEEKHSTSKPREKTSKENETSVVQSKEETASTSREKSRRAEKRSTPELRKERSSDSNTKSYQEEKTSTSELKKQEPLILKGRECREVDSSASDLGQEERRKEEAESRKEKSSDLEKGSHKEEETSASESAEKKSSDLRTKSRQTYPSTSESKEETSSTSKGRSRKEEEPSTLRLKREGEQSLKEKTRGKEDSAICATRKSPRQAAKSSKESERNEKAASESKTMPKQRVGKISQKEKEETSGMKASRIKKAAPEPEFESPPAGESKADPSCLTSDNSKGLLETANKNMSSRSSVRYKRSENSVKEGVPDTACTTETKSGQDKIGNSTVVDKTTTNDELTHLLKEANRVETSSMLPDNQATENIPFSRILEEIRSEEALMEPPEKPQSVQAQSENPTPESSRDTAFTEDSVNTSTSRKRGRRKSGNSRMYVKTRSSSRLHAKLEKAAKETSTEVSADVSLLQVLQLEEIRRTSTSPKTPSKVVLSSNMELPSSPLPTLVSDVQRVLEFPSFSSLTSNISDLTVENLHQRLIASALGEAAPFVADFTPVSSSSRQSAKLPDSTACLSSPTNKREIPLEDIPMSSTNDIFIMRSPESVNKKGSAAKSGLSTILSVGKRPREEICSVSTGDLSSSRQSALTHTKGLSSDGVSRATYINTTLVPSTPTNKLKGSCEDVSSIFIALEDVPVTHSSTSFRKEIRRSEASKSSAALGKSPSASSGSPVITARLPDHLSLTASDGTTIIEKVMPGDVSGLLALLHSPITTGYIERCEVFRSPDHSNRTTADGEVMPEDASTLLALLDSPSTSTKEVCSDGIPASSAEVSDHSAATSDKENVTREKTPSFSAACDSTTEFLVSMNGKKMSSEEISSAATSDSLRVPPREISDKSELERGVSNTAVTLYGSTTASSATVDENNFSQQDASSLLQEASSVILSSALENRNEVTSEIPHVPTSENGHPDILPLVPKDNEVISRKDVPLLSARGDPASTTHRKDVKEGSHKRALSFSDPANVTKDVPATESPSDKPHDKVHSLPNNVSDQPALKCITSQKNYTNADTIAGKKQTANCSDNPSNDSQALQWNFKVLRRTKVEVKMVIKSPPPAPVAPVSPINEVHHRQRSRSRSPPRSHMRENHPPGRPDHGHGQRRFHHPHPRERRSPPPYRSRSPAYHRPSRRDERRHGFDFSRRSRSCSPFVRRHQRHHRFPAKLPTGKKERELFLFGRSPGQGSPIHKPARDSAIHKPARNSATHKPVQDAATRKPVQDAATHKPAQVNPIHKPVQNTAIHKRVQNTAIHKPVQNTPIHKPVQNTAIHKRVQNTAIHKPVQNTAIHKPAQVTSIHKPVQDNPIHNPAQDSAAHKPARDCAIHKPAQQSGALVEPQRPIIMTLSRKRKTVKLEDDGSVSAKPVTLSSSSRLVQTPLDFRERYADVFSNTGESSDSETDGVTFSDSPKSDDSDDSYRPKRRKRRKAPVSKPETKRPRIQENR